MTLEKKNFRQLLIHFLLWVTFYSLLLFPSLFEFRSVPKDLPFRLAVITVLFYFNYHFLVPKLLLKKRHFWYVLVSIALIAISMLAINLTVENYFPSSIPRGRPLPSLPPLGPQPSLYTGRPLSGRPFIDKGLLFQALGFCAPFVVSAFLRMYAEWEKNETQKKIVENQKIQAELQFLKTQLNPHFLFNSLNAIYSLSVKKSPDTSDAIINLSELMRYMLYEADKDFAPVSKEIEYIKNYVQLQHLRLSDSENVSLKISGNEKDKKIPPLLFISFIENAFKYGTDFRGRTFVKINLLIKNESIHLHVQNKIGSYKKQSNNHGVGLTNIKNRLKLLYPDSHTLIVSDNDETYTVDLTLKL